MEEPLRIAPAALAALRAHLGACWPAEGCGILLGRDGEARRFEAIDNQADRYHAADPESFPRTSRDYFILDARKAERLARTAEAQGEAWLAIVHSHVDCGDHFSAEDAAAMAPEGEPAYPGLWQVVASCRAGRVASLRAHRWEGGAFRDHGPLPAE
jgi:proteasome lid subunit RPN8/RPN11